MSVSNSVLRMNERETVRFVELYESETTLWNPTDAKYKKKDARNAAAERIAAQLAIENFTAKNVLEKFKNLRSSYLQELKKIKDSTKSGCSADDVYVPKVIWFRIMDRFLKSHVTSRKTHSNLKEDIQDTGTQDVMDIQTQDTQDTQDIYNKDINTQDVQIRQTQDVVDSASDLHSGSFEQAGLSNQLLLSKTNTEQTLQSEYRPNNPKPSIKIKTIATEAAGSHKSSQFLSKGKKREISNTLSSTSTTKKTKTAPSAPLQSNIDAALQKLDNISRTAQTSLANQYREDHLDHFGKYLVSLLRNVPLAKSYALQQKMISQVMEAHVPDSVPPETPTSVEDVTSESVDDYRYNRYSPQTCTPTHDAMYGDISDLYQREYTQSLSDCADVETDLSFTNL